VKGKCIKRLLRRSSRCC